MAKAVAVCTCGNCGAKFEKVKILRNRTEANNWESWAVEHLTTCYDCWKKEQEEADKKADAEFAPITVGTEKQIAWAVKLRLEAQEDFRTLCGCVKESKRPLLEDACKKILNKHTDARFWIDTRGDRFIRSSRIMIEASDFWMNEFKEAGFEF